ncbi:MAG: D-2-hydroxyacid dehydrogenase [Dehalococcoidia bacterium]|nr:D-2-hydroxyacid dehydrogenase [Dehalococcoidia bacterium]
MNDVVHVLVVSSVTPALLQQMRSVSTRLLVEDGAALLLNVFGAALRPGQAPPQPPAEGSDLDEMLAQAEVILAPRRLPGDTLQRAPHLKWIQATSAGIDFLDNTGILETDIVLTTASGIHVVPMTEYVVTAILYFTKEVSRLMENKNSKSWDRFNLRELKGQTIGVIGLGNIGMEIARVTKALGMNVLGVRRSKPSVPVPFVDAVYRPSDLGTVLKASDFVALAVPITPETKHMIGEVQLREMRPNSVLINISRGSVVDEAALVVALKEGWIGGAALDVFEAEPLSLGSELWDLPNVFMTPHISALSDQYDDRAAGLFCENLRRYLAGDQLINQVDKSKGY